MPSCRHLAFITSVLAIAGCAAPPITGCDAAHGITPVCGFQNPEDLAPAPDGKSIIVSQFGTGESAGSLVLFEPASGNVTPLFPAADAAYGKGWGDPACPPPDTDAFSPHGIDTERLTSGATALYVVNHGGRESVEMFQVADDAALTWRGCVEAPAEGFFNDLVVLRDGGFWVSQMLPGDANFLWVGLRSLFTDYTSGFVYVWRDGFTKIPGSDAKLANGVEKSADERHLFVNSYMGDQVIKVDVASGTAVAAVSVASPDNLSWAPDGRLLAASHHGSLGDVAGCGDLSEGSCGFRFEVVAIDTDTMAAEVLMGNEGAPMGAATVALPLNDRLYLGTFAGDRIAYLSYPPAAPAK